MLIIGLSISFLGAVVAFEVVRGMLITRRIERNAKSGLSHRQLIARGMI
jgi:hypothetical protein